MAALVAPARSFWLGTLEDATVKLWCWRRPSYAKKKKTLFFLIGPPPLAPKSLRLKGACGFGAPVDVSRVLKSFRASSALLRKNSNNSAWYSFVPERVARLTMAPAFRPYCAGKEELSILYSARVSIGGWKVIWFCTLSFRLIPLTSQFVVSSRCPAVLMPKEPCPRSGAERNPFAGGATVPVVSKLRSVKWRPFRGISCTVLLLMIWPRLVVVVSTTAASAVISTVSAAWPTFI